MGATVLSFPVERVLRGAEPDSLGISLVAPVLLAAATIGWAVAPGARSLEEALVAHALIYGVGVGGLLRGLERAVDAGLFSRPRWTRATVSGLELVIADVAVATWGLCAVWHEAAVHTAALHLAAALGFAALLGRAALLRGRPRFGVGEALLVAREGLLPAMLVAIACFA